MESPGSSERIRTSKERYYEVEAGNAHHPNTDLPEERALDSPPPPVTSPKDEESGSQPDSNVVWWDEPADQDPANPMNWSNRKKWANIGILSSVTFLTPLASSMFAPGVPQVMSEFGATSDLLATFVVAVYVLGFAFGPLLLAPLSEIYGRVPVYNVCNVFFVVFTVLCAEAKSMGMLVAVRFFAGFAGVAVITCGGGTIADLMEPERRGGAIAIWSVGPILGPVVGPVAGGFLVQAKGWRWVFWVLTIAASVATVVAFIFLRETYAPVLLERKAARLRKQTGNPALQSKLSTKETQLQLFNRSILRPTKLMFLSPIVSMMCVYTAVAYGILYILFTTFTFVFEEVYSFSTANVGLSYLGSGIGTLCGLAFVGTYSDRFIKKVEASGKQIRPEDRLPFLVIIPSALSLPIGLIIYGWTTDKHVHWIVPMIGTGITGFGMIGLVMCIQTYLIDAFTVYAASATAANAVLRSVLGALLPLCALDMYDSLGLGWGNTLLGFLALALAPIPLLFRVYGERIRTNPRWRVEL